jgi:hypothetical protein
LAPISSEAETCRASGAANAGDVTKNNEKKTTALGDIADPSDRILAKTDAFNLHVNQSGDREI